MIETSYRYGLCWDFSLFLDSIRYNTSKCILCVWWNFKLVRPHSNIVKLRPGRAVDESIWNLCLLVKKKKEKCFVLSTNHYHSLFFLTTNRHFSYIEPSNVNEHNNIRSPSQFECFWCLQLKGSFKNHGNKCLFCTALKNKYFWQNPRFWAIKCSLLYFALQDLYAISLWGKNE